MKRKKIIAAALIGTLLTASLAGCDDSIENEEKNQFRRTRQFPGRLN